MDAAAAAPPPLFEQAQAEWQALLGAMKERRRQAAAQVATRVAGLLVSLWDCTGWHTCVFPLGFETRRRCIGAPCSPARWACPLAGCGGA